MKKIQVVGAIIIQDQKLLAAQRAANRVLGGYWEFPGGKIEPGEAPEAAVVRELQEEFGVTVTVLSPLTVAATEPAVDSQIELHCYYVRLETEITKTIAHDELQWVTPAEAERLDWAPSDVPVIKTLVKSGFGDEY